jgi:hypothetical protein
VILVEIIPFVTALGKAIKGAYDAHYAGKKAEEHANVSASTSDQSAAEAARGLRAGQLAKRSGAIASAVTSLLTLPADILLPGTGVGAAIRLAVGIAAKGLHHADLKQFNLLSLVLWHLEDGPHHRQVMKALGLTDNPTRTVGAVGLAQHQMFHASVSAERSSLAKSEVVPFVARDLSLDEAYRSMAITEGPVTYEAWGKRHTGTFAGPRNLLKKTLAKRMIAARIRDHKIKEKLAAADALGAPGAAAAAASGLLADV